MPWMCPDCGGPLRVHKHLARCKPCATQVSLSDMVWIDEELERKCLRCGEVKPIDRFVLYRGDRPTAGARERHCMDCQNYYRTSSPSRTPGFTIPKKRLPSFALGLTEGAVSRLRRLGMSIQTYLDLLQWQSDLCGICGSAETAKTPTGEVSRLSVDHDHSTGLIRGVICRACNNALGNAKDDPARLRAMADYLEEHAAAVAYMGVDSRQAPESALRPRPPALRKSKRTYDAAGRLMVERLVNVSGFISVANEHFYVGQEYEGRVLSVAVADDHIQTTLDDGLAEFGRTNSDYIWIVRATKPKRGKQFVDPDLLPGNAGTEKVQVRTLRDRNPRKGQGNLKVTNAMVVEMKALYATGQWLQRDLASRYNISTSHVGAILNGKVRAYASEQPPVAPVAVEDGESAA